VNLFLRIEALTAKSTRRARLREPRATNYAERLQQMLSILVGHSYFLRFDRKQLERAKPYPPLATLQVAAQLRRAGHSVALFDAMLADGVDEYRGKLEAAKPQLVLLYEDNFNFLSKMCLGKMRRAACEMIALAHSRGARIITAGADVTDAPEPYLRAGSDLVLLGEGLSALEKLLPRIATDPRASSADLAEGVPGVAWLTASEVRAHRGVPAPQVSTHDALPAWELVDIDRYRRMWLESHAYFSLNMAASRGCPFRCTWCAKPIWGNRYLQREPAAVALEMAQLKHTFHADHIWFADDIFGLRVEWVREFARRRRAEDAELPFTIQTRADLITEHMAVALADAGCQEAWIGAESGSQRVLDAMHKGTEVDEILRARQRLKAVGVRVGFFIQLGYLGEELSDILATRQLLDAALPDDVGVSVSYPLPGTKFYDLVKAQLGRKTHWQESDDLDMMFHGTYTTDFYRTVRKLLHDRISLEKLSAAPQAARYRHGRRILERRWQHLIASERQHRNGESRAAAN
jgi:anaerobic magnesium-protoporphyrin IX monomethyl ester cyclase